MEEENEVEVETYETPEPEEVQESEQFNWIVPDCCKEGWDTCPHVAKPDKPRRVNIGL